MRFSVAAFTVFGVLASASAFTLERRQFPTCATSCLTNANLGGCQETDTTCLCKSQAFVSSTTTCITSSCQGSDLATAEAAAQALCAAVGVTLSSSSPSSTAGSSSSSAPASSGTATSPASSGTSVGTSKTASGTSATASGSAPASSGTSSAPPAATSSTSGASSHSVNGLAGLAAIGLVALAL